MPEFKRNIVVKVARGVKAYLELRAGVTRRDLYGEFAPEPNTSFAGTKVGGIDPKNIVWIFGSGRSGSTWLSSMMGDMEGHALWGEPWVGALFGNHYYREVDVRKHKTEQFILGLHREAWLRSIRYFILDM